MARNNKSSRAQPDPLAKWLALNWQRLERSYNPDVRDFLAGLLGYPKECVVTEDISGAGCLITAYPTNVIKEGEIQWQK